MARVVPMTKADRPAMAVTLTRPTVDDPWTGDALARCLSEAFSSGLWRDTPMPLGHPDDPTSARGIIGGLGPDPLAVAAMPRQEARVIGCVLGCVMDERVVQGYGLGDYGAQPGDGLLAFIGIVPEAQGLRLRPEGDGTLGAAPAGPSLARHLFEDWLGCAELSPCPRLFIRTRRRIGPIRYLSEDLGFAFRGGFETEFRGQTQRRLVYCRTNPAGGAP